MEMHWPKLKIGAPIFALLILCCPGAFCQEKNPWGNLKPGRYEVGFRLAELFDSSRSNRNLATQSIKVRHLRMYAWYPVAEATGTRMLLADYLKLCAEEGPSKPGEDFVPVQLVQGFSTQKLADLRRLATHAFRDAKTAEGAFPLVVVGQGLYYESPVTHAILSEFLASHGYFVIAAPLTGTHNQLAQLSAADLETQVRDMEFIIGEASEFSSVDRRKLGIIGYDLGGMAGMLLAMRNPAVSAFASLDSGILYPHPSGLPQSHPSYDERRFIIPWMHLTQARFVHEEETSSFVRKTYGDSYLARVPVDNHGVFTLYAALGIEHAVPAYWGKPEGDLAGTYASVCELAKSFLDAYLKDDRAAAEELKRSSSQAPREESKIQLEYKSGRPQAAEPQAEIIDFIIEHGFSAAKEKIKAQLERNDGEKLFDEKPLAWLGYHFLYWWNRPQEAVEVFALLTETFPESLDAHSGLASALMANNRLDEALLSFRKILELDPNHAFARQMVERLTSEDPPLPQQRF